MRKMFFIFFVFLVRNQTFGQTPAEWINKVRAKLEKVNDYTAKGKLKTNVVFIKAPVASVKVYYKRPDKMKIVNENGISFIPKGSVNINLAKFLSAPGNYEIVDAGKEAASGWRILKLLPTDENSDIVLSTLYIDEKDELVKKAKNTTRDNGTYELEMSYGRYASFGLPDKVVFSFNTKDYKLPKGVTFDYDDRSAKKPDDSLKNRKGRVEIIYSEYSINKGVDDTIFKESKSP
jgi:outer membrane lipoprotein-sorting protein